MGSDACPFSAEARPVAGRPDAARPAPTVRIGDLDLPARWLRDHGDDPASVNPVTGQREVDTFAIPRGIEAVAVRDGDERVEVDWSDGATTEHDRSALLAVVHRPRSPAPERSRGFAIDPGAELWSAAPSAIEPFPAEVIDDDGRWPAALAHLRRRGWVCFDGAPLGRAIVERLAGRVGYVRRTLFGDVWTMAPGPSEHRDSAYAPVPLDVHTDGTYSHDGPGTIVFAQQEKDGEGGHSVLVDGFAVARDLALAAPEAADLLTRFAVRGRYVEPGVAIHADRPPLRVDAEGALRQVSFNNYDRAPVLPAPEWVDAVIDAYGAFRTLMVEPERRLVLPWTPGRVLLVDNWRLLHGRTEYSGNRVFLGCYTNHEDLESAYRLAGFD